MCTNGYLEEKTAASDAAANPGSPQCWSYKISKIIHQFAKKPDPPLRTMRQSNIRHGSRTADLFCRSFIIYFDILVWQNAVKKYPTDIFSK